jgi:hypothetical protein
MSRKGLPMKRHLNAGLAVAALGVGLFTSFAHAEPGGGPFTALQGSWSGGGSFTTSFGSRESLRCRSTNSVGAGGTTLQLNLRCASASTNLVLTADVQARGNAVSGSWSESTYGVSGRLSGRAQGDRIVVQASSDMLSANLTVITTGNRQSIHITPRGGDFGVVSVSMTRR